MTGLLWRAQWRYLRSHPWQLILGLLGIALGVAVVIAVDLANHSAKRAFDLSLQSLLGRTSHVIEGSAPGIDEAVYRWLRVERGIAASAPIVEGYAMFRGEMVHILGVDVFAEAPFQRTVSELDELSTNWVRLLTESGTVLVNAQDRDRWNIAVGDDLGFTVAGRARQAQVLGVYPGNDEQDIGMRGVWLTDIGTAQVWLETLGRLTRIDLQLSPQDVAELEAALPPGLHIEAAPTRNRALDEMTRAFRLNLTALSLLALMIGMFLIYNITTFMALNRRTMLGTLRLVGVTRAQLFALMLGEAALLGLLGGVLGVLLGIGIAQGLLHLVTRTINDLYFVLNVRELSLPLLGLGKGLLLGLVAAVIAAAVPAWEAAHFPPQQALQRSTLEYRVQRLLPKLAWLGVCLTGIGTSLLWWPNRSLVLAFVALFLMLLGLSLCLPWLTRWVMDRVTPAVGAVFGLTGRLATRGISAAISRTGIAIAALTLAVAATVGVATMIDSFRQAVLIWLESTLRADFYVSLPGPDDRPGGLIDPAVARQLATVDGVAEVTAGQRVEIDTDRGPATLLALDLGEAPHRHFTLKDHPAPLVWEGLRRGEGVLVAEPFAYRRELKTGDRLRLQTAGGWVSLPILGVFRDYSSEQGFILMHRPNYQALWADDAVMSIGIFLAPHADSEKVRADLQACLAAFPQTLRLASNRAIRNISMGIFDRTFAITHVLRLLAVLVAVVGIFSALIALQLERAREYAVLRATGYTPLQVAGLIGLQSGLMGAMAGVAALPLGVGMGALLIAVINQRAFGWSMALQVNPMILLQALLLAVVAAIIASVYPAWRLSRAQPALALQSE